jgi:beta-glucan synthesis-associated protein KRE6
MENAENRGLQYRSGMLQSWNKFCFSGGYIEVSMTLPGPNMETQGYVSSFFLEGFGRVTD